MILPVNTEGDFPKVGVKSAVISGRSEVDTLLVGLNEASHAPFSAEDDERADMTLSVTSLEC